MARTASTIVALTISIAWGCESHESHEAHDPPAQDHAAHDHAAHDHAAHQKGPAARPSGRSEGPAADAVRAEMRLLEVAMQGVLSDVANGRLGDVSERLAPVHQARQATVEAVEAHGYAPPRHGDDGAGFERADDAFHGELEALLEAASRDDLQGSTRQLGVILSGCTSCHAQYRFEPH